MTRDVTNMPFGSDGGYGDDSRSSSGSTMLDTSLKLEAILLEEFNYANVTAYQAMEDRARMFNLYLLLVGILASGLGAVFQLGGEIRAYLPPLAVALLIVTGFMGFVFFVQLIRLRQAHRESLISMNKIKKFYIEQFRQQLPNIEGAFHWRLETIPAGERFGSVTFLVCYTVAFLGSMCLAAAALVSDQYWFHSNLLAGVSPLRGHESIMISAAVFIIFLALHVTYYRRTLLNRKRDRRNLARDVDEVAAAALPIKPRL